MTAPSSSPYAFLFSVLLLPWVQVHSFPVKWHQVSRSHNWKHVINASNRNDNNNNNNNNRIDALTRRNALLTFLLTTAATAVPLQARAGPVGAMITKAVTTSDLGVSVRQSVVRGAQLMDQLDGQWEQFSDTHGLGTERSKQSDRPSAKPIPPLKPLDMKIAKELLQNCDEVFAEVTGISKSQLQRQVADMKEKVQPSFQRSAGGSLAGDLVSAEQLNFISYAHFRTYGDLLLEYKTDFAPFRKAFEQELGERLCNLLTIVKSGDTDLSKNAMLANRLYALDQVKEILVEKGLVAQVDQSPIPSDRIDDWADDLAELSFSVALDMDATLGAQLLLEEQGFRLLPCYGRYMMLYILQMNGQKVTMDPYYFDTNYNSNPALFEVKEVLLNVVIESTL